MNRPLQLDLVDLTLPSRPRTRGECIDGPRPCPWVGCRYHLALDVSSDGRITERWGDDLEAMPHTCALDVADRGGLTGAAVASLLGLSPSSVSGAERRAKAELASSIGEAR